MKNCQQEASLASNVFWMLKEREEGAIVRNSLKMHSIDVNLRAKMVDWLVEVVYKFELGTITFFRAVKIMDRFLQLTNQVFASADVLIIGVTALFIAAKLEDSFSYSLRTFVHHMGHDKFTEKQVISLEKKMLVTLAFEVDIVVSLEFLEIIVKAYDLAEPVKYAAENALVLFQLYYNTQYSPSIEAVCALILALGPNSDFERTVLIPQFSSCDFSSHLHTMQSSLSEYPILFSKMRNPFIYRHFELIPSSPSISFRSLSEEPSLKVTN
jgi:hypothetical protein